MEEWVEVIAHVGGSNLLSWLQISSNLSVLEHSKSNCPEKKKRKVNFKDSTRELKTETKTKS